MRTEHRVKGRTIAGRSAGLWFASLAALAPASFLGCTVTPKPLTPVAVASEVEDRATTIGETLQALDSSGFAPLFSEPPETDAMHADAGTTWHAFAWAYSRETVTARRRLLAARARVNSTGLPGPIGLGAETLEFDDVERQTQARMTFDLLGLVGLGRSAAAEHLATAEERYAYGELEQAVWSSRFAVDRARVRVAAAAVRVAVLEDLVGEVDADTKRFDLLDDRGWLPPDQVAAARAMADRLRRRAASARAEAAESLDALAKAAGLPLRSEILADITANTLEGFAPLAAVEPVPEAAELLRRQPELRVKRLEYAVAEARLRRVAAEAWPDLRIGPRLRLDANSSLVGGVLDLSLPWPGSVTGLVDAAQQERELARELLEDSLVSVLATATSRRVAFTQAQEILRRYGPTIETGTASAWRAARARFAVDPGALMTWTDRLERRIQGCVAALDAQEQAILAELNYRDVIGARTRPEDRR